MKRVLFIFFILTLPLLCACLPNTSQTLKVASNNWIGYTPLYLANSLGFYRNANIKLIEMSSATEVIHALRMGTIEVAALTLDETLTIIDDGYDLQIIAILDVSNGGDVLLTHHEITQLSQLKNKKIGVEYTAVGALVLDAALTKAGLNVNQVTVVPCSFDEHLACFERVDALVTFEPVYSRLLRQDANVLFSSLQMPNLIIDVLVTTRASIETQPEQLQHLVNGYFKAQKELQVNSEDALKTISDTLNIPTLDLHHALAGVSLPSPEQNMFWLASPQAKIYSTIEQLQSIMIRRNLLSSRVHTSELANPTFIQALP